MTVFFHRVTGTCERGVHAVEQVSITRPSSLLSHRWRPDEDGFHGVSMLGGFTDASACRVLALRSSV